MRILDLAFVALLALLSLGVVSAHAGGGPCRLLAPSATKGRKLFKQFGCDVCHSTDGKGCFGGTLKGLWGTTATLEGGKKMQRNEAYFGAKIRESAKLPLLDGSNVMPIYKDSIRYRDLVDIIAYIKSLGTPASVASVPRPQAPKPQALPASKPVSRPAQRQEKKAPSSRPSARKKAASVTDKMPRNDIFLANVTWQAGKLHIVGMTRVTNRKAYDNQPAFLPGDKRLLYTSLREGSQTDIFAYDIAKKTHMRLTHTPESEFSPTPMPDGKRFSTVRVEKDGTQRLWAFPISRKSTTPQLLFPNLKPVGYHAWGSADALIFFILGKPHTLHLGSLRTQQTLPIVGSIGRGMAKIPGRAAFVFVHKLTKKRWWLKSLDIETKSVAFLRETVPGSEDVTLGPKQVAVMGKGSLLYQWKLGSKKPWAEVVNLARFGVSGITRVVFDSQGKQLAIVGKRGVAQKPKP